MQTILKNYKEEYVSVAKRFETQAKTENMHTDFHIFIYTIIHRTIQINNAIVLLMEQKNIEATIPMLRILMDSLLIAHGCYLVEKPIAYCSGIMKGIPSRKMKDKTGQNLTLKYLAMDFDRVEDTDNMENLYTFLCSFIHFSESHLASVVSVNDTGDITLNIDGSIMSENKEFVENVIGSYNDLNTTLLKTLDRLFRIQL